MHIHGGNVEEIARQYGLREEEIINFSANINPLGPPSKVIKALKENLDKIARYPDTALKNVGCQIKFFPLKSKDKFRINVKEL